MDQIFSTSLENCVNVDLETLKQRMEKGESRESVERNCWMRSILTIGMKHS